MMNIKLYAALAACLGAGYGGGVVVTQHDIDRANAAPRMAVQCEDSEATRQFRAPPVVRSNPKGF